MKILPFILLYVVSVLAQTPKVNLAWLDTRNPSTTTYNVYRATGLCSGSPSFNKIATGVAVKSYSDSSVVNGNNYCYYVTATLNNLESSPSTSILVTLAPYPPENVTAVIP